jgi:hypothetical protein
MLVRIVKIALLTRVPVFGAGAAAVICWGLNDAPRIPPPTSDNPVLGLPARWDTGCYSAVHVPIGCPGLVSSWIPRASDVDGKWSLRSSCRVVPHFRCRDLFVLRLRPHRESTYVGARARHLGGELLRIQLCTSSSSSDLCSTEARRTRARAVAAPREPDSRTAVELGDSRPSLGSGLVCELWRFRRCR